MTLQQTPPIVTTEALRNSIKNYKKDSKGVDNWTATELRAVPDLVLDSFTNVLNNSLKVAATPHQNLMSLHPCLGKPNNGARTICKTPMIFRNQSRVLFHDVVKWELDNPRDYDSAQRGSSALQSALYKSLMAEMAHFNHQESIMLLADYEKFVDTVDLPLLIQSFIDTGYPLHQANMSIQQHIAPRVIKAEGCSSQPIPINRSIIAGDMQSVAFTRSYLKDPMTKLDEDNPGVKPKLFVDDTSLYGAGPEGETYNKVIKAIL